MTPRLWSVLTTVAVVAAGASASPAAAAPPPPPTTAVTGAAATAPAADEPQVTVTGTLRRVAVAAPDGTRSTVAAVVTADGDAVQVRTEDVTEVPGRAQVEVTVPGSAADTAVLEPGGGAAVTDVEVVDAGTGAAAVKAAAVARPVYLMSATLPGTVMDPSVDLAVTSAAIADASDYFSLSTDSAISFAPAAQQDAGAFADWGDPSSCTTDQIFAFFDWASVQAGVFPSNGSGSHVVVQTPMFAPCETFGMMADIDDGGTVWINGLQGSAGDQLDGWLLAQALGHTLGLGFSDTRYGCAGLPDGSYDDCRDGFLGSAYDVMGLVLPESGDLAGAPGLLNAAQLDILGLLTSDNTVFASSAYTATLNPVGSTSGWRYLVVQTEVARYYVELRGTAGLDADLGSTRLGCPQGIADCVPTVYQPGVLVYRVDGYPWLGSDTYLVEANATHPAYGVPASTFTLEAGRTLVTEDGILSLRREASSPAGTATVSVADGPGSAVHVPSGNFEGVSSAPGKVRLRGWAIDRDTRLSSYLVVSVAGRGQLARASVARPDIARFFPEQGVNHGFDVTLDAPAGTVSVCVTVINTGLGKNTSLGCRTTTVAGGSPVGVLEKVTVAPGKVTFAGWALDPDTAASSYVYVSAGTQAQHAMANQTRPDLLRFFPTYGEAHGFSTTLAANPGTQTVCATAVNFGAGTHTSLGCRTVTVPTASPIGNLDYFATASWYTVYFRGWAVDPDATGPVTIAVDVDGRRLTTEVADESRPDIAQLFPASGAEHGFSGWASLPAGAKSVCVWAINRAGGTNTNMGCRSVPPSPGMR